MEKSYKRIVFLNTLVNYALFIVTFITAIFTTRILFLGLGEVAYGFWVLVWSIFGYSLLLDFGFGTSVKKYTAEVIVTKDYKVYNKQISTVFSTYTVMSIIIIIATVILQSHLQEIFKFPPDANLHYYRKVFVFLGIGVALTFPTGTFQEILNGLNKIYIGHSVKIVRQVINVLGIWLIIKFNYGLIFIAIFSVLINFFTNIILAYFSYKLLPKLKIRLTNFDFSMLKEVISFSFFAYLVMFANIIIHKTDQIVLGIMLGVSAVAIYQVGSRISDILNRVSGQFQASLTPIAATLFKDKQYQRLQDILLRSNKLITFIVVINFIILTVLAKPILYVWLEINDPRALQVAYIMNISVLLLIIFRSGSSKVLLMTGHHKFLSKVAVVESFLNVGFSILFIKLMGIIGVAFGTLLPNIIISLFFIFPAGCKFSKVKPYYYISKIYLPIIVNSILPVLVLLYFRNNISEATWNVGKLAYSSVAAATIYIITGYLFILNKQDRQKIKDITMSIIHKTRAVIFRKNLTIDE
ncbi:MAG: oligosaccharide flippase family protein [Candidatus Cloacimonadota bacterium]|nr:oligosaccharide flippase family protein [Candidatus Cloacimonadota bacterium]